MLSAMAHGREEVGLAGEARGEARGVLGVLEARGITVTAEQRSRILTCADTEVLDRWIRRAVSVTRADELFVE